MQYLKIEKLLNHSFNFFGDKMSIESKISSHFGGATVSDVQIDEFSGEVYARINGNRSAYIGQAEDFT